MKMYFKRFFRKARLKSFFSLILLSILIIQTAIPYGLAAFALDTATTGISIYVNGTSGSDQNSGTSTSPYLTIAKAVSVLQTGDTLYIAAGTYNEPLVLSGMTGITVVGEANTVISGSVNAIWTEWGNDYPAVLNVDKSSDIDISNIHFIFANDIQNAGYDSTALVVDSVNVNIHNCIIEAGSSVAACIQVNANKVCSYTFDSNILKGGSTRGFWAPWGINVASRFTNNIVENPVSIDLTPDSSTYKYSASLAIENNTCLGSFEASAMTADGSADGRTIVANNIFGGFNVNTDASSANYINNSCIVDSNYVFSSIGEVAFKDAANGDYSLTAVSPCNDAGTKKYEADMDILGNARLGYKADVGAYQYGKVYYVSEGGSSSAAGTLDAPLSLAGALTKLAPGDTAYLQSGWYAGVYDLSKYTNMCGSEHAYIYITNYNGAEVHIYGNSNTNNALTATSANNYIDISGCTFQFDNDVAWRAEETVKLYGVSYFRLHDCTIAGGSYALRISDDSNNCEVYNNTFVDNANDLYINGIRDSKIYNNIFKLGSGARIYNWAGSITNTVFSNNVFTGSMPAMSIDATTVVTGNVIANNIFATADSTISPNVLNAANNNIVDYNYFAEIPLGVGSHNVTGELFCDGDFRITSADSVLYNAGNDQYAPVLDRDGNARIGASDIGMYEAVGLDLPQIIPEWGKNMVHPALLNSADLNNVIADLKNGVETPDPDEANIGASLENVWGNVKVESKKYLDQDYFLDTANKRICLYYPYVMQPVSWASTSSMQVGDLVTADSYAQRSVTGIAQSTYYVNFDFKPISPASANEYIIYSSLSNSNSNGVVLKMSNSKVYVSDGSAGNFVEVPNLVLEDGKWYNIYITVNQSGTGASSLIIHPRGAAADYRAGFSAFGAASVDGILAGCKGTGSTGKAHYDNMRIYDTYVPVVKDSFANLDAWTKSGTVLKSNEAAYPSSVGSYNWTGICGDLQTIIQDLAITYYAKNQIGDADADLYFEKTKQLLLSIAHWDRWGDPDEPEKASLDIGYLTIGMCNAYDLLYNDLTPDERSVIAKAIKTRGVDKLYQGSIDVNEYGYYDGVSIVTNTTYVQNAALGIACLAVGDVFNTEKELAVARNNFASAYKNGLDEDGAWIEGFIYGDLAIVYALPFHDADNRITGDNEINNKYLMKIIDYVIYNMCPGGKYYSNIADNARLSYQYKKIMEYYTKHGKNKYTAWALKRLGSLPNSLDMLSLVWFPSGAAITEPTEDKVALGKLFGDIGVAALKTGWGTEDSLMTLKSSKLTSYMRHHTHLDQNSIELMRGTSDLLCDPGYQSWSGIWRDYNHGTLGHNTLVVNGGSQNNFDGSTQWTQIFGGQIENFFIGDKYGFSVGSAALAYTDLTTMKQPIPEWRRSIVDLIGSDYYVLFDDYQTSKDNTDLVWQLHTKGIWAKDTASNAMVTTMDNDQLAVIFLNTNVNDISIKTDADYGYDYIQSIYTTLKNGKENNNLLALLYPSAKGAALPTSTYLSDADDNGVVVQNGSNTDVVMFHKDSTEPVVLSGAEHAASLGAIAVDSGRVYKIAVKYTAASDTKLLQDGIEIGTLVGDGTERIDTFVLNASDAGSVTLSAAGDVTVSDVWSAATIKTDVADTTNDTITLPNPDRYYDMKISYTGAQNAVVSQDGVVIGTLPDGNGTAVVQLQMPYTEAVADGVRTAKANVTVTGTSTYSIKLAETEKRTQIGRTCDVGGDNDKDNWEFCVPGVSVAGDNWSVKTLDGSTNYRSGTSGANLYVNSPSTRNSYKVYIKYKANTTVPVYQYRSMKTKKQVAELPVSSGWRVAAFDLKEYTYSAESVDKDQVINRLLEFGADIVVDSAWIELRDSDIQIDYNDVGKQDDTDMIKHTQGLVIGSNFAAPDMDARMSEGNGTILANITDANTNYYVTIDYTSVAGGTIKQLLDEAGTVAEVAAYDANEESGRIRFRLNGHYYDSDAALRAANVLLSFTGDINISDMWLEKEVRTQYDIPDEVDYINGMGSSTGAFTPEKYIAYKPNTAITVDGDLSSDEMWNLNLDMPYGTTGDEFTAKAGVKWDTNNLYLAVQVTDDEDFDAAADGYPYDVLDGDGIEVYIAKTRGLTAYDINTVQYCISTINGIYVGGGCVDRNRITADNVNYIVKRNSTNTGYTMEISIPWQSIGGMSVAAGDRIGFNLHAYDKDTNEDQQTIGLTEQYLIGDWNYPYYWPELSLNPDVRVPAKSIDLSQTKATMEFGDALSLTAFVNPINSNDTVKFTSSDNSIATVDKWGNVRALKPGTATITASAGDIEKNCTITVNTPATSKTIKLSKSQYLLGESITAYYTGSFSPDWIGIYNYGTVPGSQNPSISWKYTTDPNGYGIITMDPYSSTIGAATGKFTANLCVNDGYDIAGSADFDVVMPISVKTVTIDRSELVLRKGRSATLSASVNQDATSDKHIIWSSSDTSVAAVDQNGRVLAMGTGTAIITATSYANSTKYATCNVTVNETVPSLVDIYVTATTGADGNAVANVDSAILQKAMDEAADGDVSIEIENVDGAKGVILNIPAQQLILAGQKHVKRISVDMGASAVTFSPEVLEAYLDKSSSNVQLAVSVVDPGTLSSSLAGIVGDNTVYDFSLSVDGNKVTKFGQEQVTIELSYTLKTGEVPEKVAVYHINAKDQLEIVRNGVYDAGTGIIKFSPINSGRYAVIYSDDNFSTAKSGKTK